MARAVREIGILGHRARRLSKATWVVVSSLFLLGPLSADTHYVSLQGLNRFPYTDRTGAATNLQSAVDAAAGGDTVLIAEGRYAVTSTVWVSRAILVEGEAGAVVRLDAQDLALLQGADEAHVAAEGPPGSVVRLDPSGEEQEDPALGF